jgi:hypothetical protein
MDPELVSSIVRIGADFARLMTSIAALFAILISYVTAVVTKHSEKND